MLTEQDFINIEKQAIKIYTNLELQIIEEIATRIAKFGYANMVVRNDILIAQEIGILYEDIIQLVANYNNKSYEEIKKIFEEAGELTISKDDKIYKKAGLNPVPMKRSRAMMQILATTIEKTNGNLQNLCMTTANTSQTQFYNVINQAYMEISTGVKSYSTAIIDAIEKISQRGAVVTYPSGHQRSMESAIRTNIVTGVNQTCGKLQLLRAEELKWDLMEITAHSGARPSHTEWQGKIVSRSGKSGYLSLDDIGYGTATGFKGVNCLHDWRPFFEGSNRTYNKKELKAMKDEKVKYQGKEISKYDASQIQRRMERQIRQDKKDIIAQNSILTNTDNKELLEEANKRLLKLKAREKLHNSIFNSFLNETGFRKDYARLKI